MNCAVQLWVLRKNLSDMCFQHGQLFLWRKERALRALQLCPCLGLPWAELSQGFVGQVGVAFSASLFHFVLEFPGSLLACKSDSLPVPRGQVLSELRGVRICEGRGCRIGVDVLQALPHPQSGPVCCIARLDSAYSLRKELRRGLHQHCINGVWGQGCGLQL